MLNTNMVAPAYALDVVLMLMQMPYMMRYDNLLAPKAQLFLMFIIEYCDHRAIFSELLSMFLFYSVSVGLIIF